MPLTPCPDCAREVPAEAPACIHCGRPLAQPPTAAGTKPMAGIAAALLLGVPSMVLAVLAIPSRYDEDVRILHLVVKAVHLVGSLALVTGALMSLAGNARGHRVVRVTSGVMIGMVLGLTAWYWVLLVGAGIPDGDTGQPNWAPLILMVAVIGAAPWLLYLSLFRRSRYP